jgi:hypothetical protein
MDENAVVNATCQRLEAQGFVISQRLSTIERGVDIIAEDLSSGCKLLVEAKGGTSSMESSARFGKPYTQTQVFDRVAKGIFTCLQLRAKHPDRSRYRVILAVPDSRWFKSYLEPVLAELKTVGIEVLFVSASGA